MNLILRSVLSVVCIMLCVSFAWAQTAETEMQTLQDGQPELLGQRANLDKVKILLDQAKEALLQGDEETSNIALEQVVEIARQAWDLNDATAAEAVFRQVLTLKPDNDDALFGLAELYRRTNPIMAVEYYSRYLQNHPSDPAAYYGRGSCYLARDAYSLAIQDLETLVTRLEPNNVGGLTNLALAYRGRASEKNYSPKLFKKAVDYMRDAVSTAESSKEKNIIKLLPELKYRFGRLMFEYQQILARAQMGDVDFSEAIDSLEESLAISSEVSAANLDDQEALNQMVLAYDALAEVYDAQIQLNAENPAPYIELAKVAQSRSMVIVRQARILALNYLKKAIEINGDDTQTWMLISEAYNQLGDIEEAKKALDKALDLEPNNKKIKSAKEKLIASTQPVKKESSETK